MCLCVRLCVCALSGYVSVCPSLRLCVRLWVCVSVSLCLCVCVMHALPAAAVPWTHAGRWARQGRLQPGSRPAQTSPFPGGLGRLPVAPETEHILLRSSTHHVPAPPSGGLLPHPAHPPARGTRVPDTWSTELSGGGDGRRLPSPPPPQHLPSGCFGPTSVTKPSLSWFYNNTLKNMGLGSVSTPERVSLTQEHGPQLAPLPNLPGPWTAEWWRGGVGAGGGQTCSRGVQG